MARTLSSSLTFKDARPRASSQKENEQKVPHHAGTFSYFGFDDGLTRSSSFKNSAVSSSFRLEGGLEKGITSDTVEPPCYKVFALYLLTPPQLLHFCGERSFRGSESALINSNSAQLTLGSFCQNR
jgi:hypothetical protein